MQLTPTDPLNADAFLEDLGPEELRDATGAREWRSEGPDSRTVAETKTSESPEMIVEPPGWVMGKDSKVRLLHRGLGIQRYQPILTQPTVELG